MARWSIQQHTRDGFLAIAGKHEKELSEVLQRALELVTLELEFGDVCPKCVDAAAKKKENAAKKERNEKARLKLIEIGICTSCKKNEIYRPEHGSEWCQDCYFTKETVYSISGSVSPYFGEWLEEQFKKGAAKTDLVRTGMAALFMLFEAGDNSATDFRYGMMENSPKYSQQRQEIIDRYGSGELIDSKTGEIIKEGQ